MQVEWFIQFSTASLNLVLGGLINYLIFIDFLASKLFLFYFFSLCEFVSILKVPLLSFLVGFHQGMEANEHNLLIVFNCYNTSHLCSILFMSIIVGPPEILWVTLRNSNQGLQDAIENFKSQKWLDLVLERLLWLLCERQVKVEGMSRDWGEQNRCWGTHEEVVTTSRWDETGAWPEPWQSRVSGQTWGLFRCLNQQG